MKYSISKLDSLFKAGGIRKDITVFDEIPSTNTELVNNIKSGIAHIDSLYLADRQSSGRGRTGKSFLSDGRGIYLSFATKNITDALTTVVAGVAVAEVLEEFGFYPEIKWVNDILINSKKVCGILAQAVSGTDIAVVGIGINFAKTDFPGDLKNIASSLEAEGGTLPSAEELVFSVVSRFEQYTAEKNSTVIEKYRKYLKLLGTDVLIKGTGERVKAIDVTSEGELLVCEADNTRRVLSSGEISIIKTI